MLVFSARTRFSLLLNTYKHFNQTNSQTSDLIQEGKLVVVVAVVFRLYTLTRHNTSCLFVVQLDIPPLILYMLCSFSVAYIYVRDERTFRLVKETVESENMKLCSKFSCIA